jgi:hypothetical protein
MARRKPYGQFHQPSHILRYYPFEMECFVYNRRILLGGAASAAILTVGVAAPAFAQAQDAPVSLSGLNSASGVLCGLALPVSGEVAAAANVIGASRGTSSSSSSTTGSNMIQANGPMQASSPAGSGFGSDGSSDNSSSAGSSTGSSTGLGSVTGTLSGVTGGLQKGG